jgi:RHS repeat-associated protein
MPSSQSFFNASTNQLTNVTYGPAGNQLAFGGLAFDYDAEGRQISALQSESPPVTYAYDGLGERVSKSVEGGLTTMYVHDVFGNLAAEYTTGGTAAAPHCTTCYLSWDHLGSTRMITDQNGVVQARHDYLPFGVEIPAGYARRSSAWGTADNVTAKFTGKERDTETNLDFFQVRYHGSAQGRFLSPDPLGNFVADPTNPQSWNLYSYVWNSPLALIDPSGLDPQVGPIYWSGNCQYQDQVSGEGAAAITQPVLIGCLPTGQQTSSATPPQNQPSEEGTGSAARNCSVNPASASQYVAATAQVALMTGQFFSGLGSTNLTFGPGTATSQVMAQSAGVQDALNEYYMVGRTSNLYTFGGSGAVAAGANPVAQFVGSFRWTMGVSTCRLRTQPASNRALMTKDHSGSVALSPLPWATPIRNTTFSFRAGDDEIATSAGCIGVLCSNRLSYNPTHGDPRGPYRDLYLQV